MAGIEVSPTEFERIGGRATTKKWKTSVRLLEADGQAGQTLGDWLQVVDRCLPLPLPASDCIKHRCHMLCLWLNWLVAAL